MFLFRTNKNPGKGTKRMGMGGEDDIPYDDNGQTYGATVFEVQRRQ